MCIRDSLPTMAFEASISYHSLFNSLFFKNFDMNAGLILDLLIKSIVGLTKKNRILMHFFNLEPNTKFIIELTFNKSKGDHNV